jgi:hypothetical protein
MQTCINCERSEDQIPLLPLEYKGQEYQICPQCLPILIHHPERLEVKFPGMDIEKPSINQ